MLENATATISIEDLDYLRACEKELWNVKRKISLSSEVIVDENENGEINDTTINVDTNSLKSLVYDYHAFSKTKNDWVCDQLSMDELKIVFK